MSPGDESAVAVVPVGWVRSPLTDLGAAPLQGDEGAPEAWIEIAPRFRAALGGLERGDEIVVLTWLHLATRDVLRTRPRDDPRRTEVGVFATRSPHRPNPIGLHRTRIVDVDGGRIRVSSLEALDGTPVLDIKAVLSDTEGR